MTAAEIAAAAAWWRCRCPVHGSHGPTLALCDGDDLIAERWSAPRRSSSDTGETA
jgi:hypothetical protein